VLGTVCVPITIKKVEFLSSYSEKYTGYYYPIRAQLYSGLFTKRGSSDLS
jgi:hypothetical protein